MDTLIRNFKIGGSLDCSVHALVEFTTLRDIGKVKARVRTLNFRRTKFQLFKTSPGKLHSEARKLNRAGVEAQKIEVMCMS